MLRLESAVCERHGTTNFSKRGGATSGIQALMSRGFQSRWRQTPGPNNTIEVNCGPLGDWMGLLGMHEVDYFSLDVEGAELLVLETLDWPRLGVGIMIVECHVNGCISAQDHNVKALLTSKGLRRVITLRTRHDIWNAAFVNDSWVGTYSRP